MSTTQVRSASGAEVDQAIQVRIALRGQNNERVQSHQAHQCLDEYEARHLPQLNALEHLTPVVLEN